MTPQPDATPTAPALGQQPGSGRPGARCECGCGRHASRRSGYRWYHGHDPGVPMEEKRAALQLGGRRGAMTAAEATRLFDQLEPNNPESRTTFRLRLMELLSVGRLTGSMYRDLLAGLDGMGKDQPKAPESKRKPVVVEIQKFTNGTTGPDATETPA